MGKHDHRSRDQKRKAKLKKRAERSHKHESLAYHGQKYKIDRYIPVILGTETGIYETFVMSDRTLTDDAVEAALERLVTELRQGPLSQTGDEEPVDLIRWNIRRNWQVLEERQELPGREDLIGILRTILSSLETWRSKSMHSQGYLRFLEGFLKQAGVSVRQIGPDDELIEEVEDDPLLVLGREWIEDDDEEAEEEFAEEVESLIESGEAERVIEVCQQLIGETMDTKFLPELQAFALLGHQALDQALGQDRRDPGRPQVEGGRS